MKNTSKINYALIKMIMSNIKDKDNRKPPVRVVIPYNLAPCYLPAVAVFSPPLSLTSVFGMGTGISSVLWAPIPHLDSSKRVD